MNNSSLISLDERRRAPLSKFISEPADTYAVQVDSDGTITLTPGRFVPDFELRLHQSRPDLVAAINQRIATNDTSTLVKRNR